MIVGVRSCNYSHISHTRSLREDCLNWTVLQLKNNIHCFIKWPKTKKVPNLQSALVIETGEKEEAR